MRENLKHGLMRGRWRHRKVLEADRKVGGNFCINITPTERTVNATEELDKLQDKY